MIRKSVPETAISAASVPGGQRVLAALRTARAEVRNRVWKLARDAAPDAGGGQVVADIHRVLA
ncbi:hypothetical protein ACIP79_11490 [Streptomyces sp. NPDC088747]|uniref:hypothetical protein n=1 Tax=Streptomyces sp. NPDC088747 TaxID=3365886 RepID=UPI003823B28A